MFRHQSMNSWIHHSDIISTSKLLISFFFQFCAIHFHVFAHFLASTNSSLSHCSCFWFHNSHKWRRIIIIRCQNHRIELLLWRFNFFKSPTITNILFKCNKPSMPIPSVMFHFFFLALFSLYINLIIFSLQHREKLADKGHYCDDFTWIIPTNSERFHQTVLFCGTCF